MTSSSNAIYDVNMQKYAYSSAGELGTQGLLPCVAIIVVFSNRDVMIEHRTDSEMYDKGDELEAIELFRDIVDNIEAMEKQHLNIR